MMNIRSRVPRGGFTEEIAGKNSIHHDEGLFDDSKQIE
jgi:hypothetical protein